jgi:hypothetical protein
MLALVDHIGTNRLSARDSGLRRVGQLTRWAAVGSGAAVVAVAAVLAGGQAAAAPDAQVAAGPATTGTLAPSTAPSTRGLQPPATAPQPSHGRSSHTSSGSS